MVTPHVSLDVVSSTTNFFMQMGNDLASVQGIFLAKAWRSIPSHTGLHKPHGWLICSLSAAAAAARAEVVSTRFRTHPATTPTPTNPAQPIRTVGLYPFSSEGALSPDCIDGVSSKTRVVPSRTIVLPAYPRDI